MCLQLFAFHAWSVRQPGIWRCWAWLPGFENLAQASRLNIVQFWAMVRGVRALRIGWRRPLGVLLKFILVLFVPSLLAPALDFSFSGAKHSLVGGAWERSTRETKVTRFSDLSPAAEASREAATEAIKAVPFTSAPGDLFGGGAWSLPHVHVY